MNNFARPTAQPDEMLQGLLGRISAANACESIAQTMAGLKVALNLPSSAISFEIAAAYLNCTPLQVARRHTLMPAYRVFSAHVGTEREEQILKKQSLVPNHSDRAKHEAMSCHVCATEDGEVGMPGRWRRLHHLPRIDWCPIHQVPLRRFSTAAFTMSPFNAADALDSELCPVTGEITSNSVLNRYAELMGRWLTRDTAISIEALSRVAKEGCRIHDLRSGQCGKRNVVSDRARELLPADWLAHYWPELLAKNPGQFIAKFDGVTKDRHVAYTGPTCALVLALLFDSTDDIEARLQAAHETVMAAPESMQASVHAAIGEFKGGASLQQASRAHGVSVGHLEQWLRALAQDAGSARPSPIAA